jgi:hypothetical protein
MIVNPKTGKVLDICGGGQCLAGAKIIMWNKHGGPNQLWIQESDGHITNPASGRSLDINGGNQKDGAEVILWTKHSG